MDRPSHPDRNDFQHPNGAQDDDDRSRQMQNHAFSGEHPPGGPQSIDHYPSSRFADAQSVANPIPTQYPGMMSAPGGNTPSTYHQGQPHPTGTYAGPQYYWNNGFGYGYPLPGSTTIYQPQQMPGWNRIGDNQIGGGDHISTPYFQLGNPHAGHTVYPSGCFDPQTATPNLQSAVQHTSHGQVPVSGGGSSHNTAARSREHKFCTAAYTSRFVPAPVSRRQFLQQYGTVRYCCDSHTLGLIEKNVVDPTLRDWVLPNFTTTTVNDTTVPSVLMMASLKQYFSYGFGMSFCGIPRVTLEGEKADWINRWVVQKPYGFLVHCAKPYG
ncbi:hypothetical protein FB45DRAFT_1067612 [Roridomyces roridus]|uniref:Uncharacterized protein n=1 Tax=Roridomyces roridus TaxID=1738132 RepID=A0AAD7B2X6_9AGAR|nr:hypothetical protein FB45DRAFT_1067612 [Roridomyces roridus]